MSTEFLEYLESINPPLSEPNINILMELGVSAKTLKLLPSDEIVNALTAKGMNRLTALDIVISAKEYFAEQEKRLQQPLGIFWDVENVRIPLNVSGEAASDMLKSAVRSLGNPIVCNAYFESIQANSMKYEKRQKLQQCGWNLMDTPHLSKREVADKTIIVDILLFILDRKGEECTVCLVADDSDFSYLLSKLRSYRHVRTVVISPKDTSFLSNSADVSMRWGADILKLPRHPAVATVGNDGMNNQTVATEQSPITVPATIAPTITPLIAPRVAPSFPTRVVPAVAPVAPIVAPIIGRGYHEMAEHLLSNQMERHSAVPYDVSDDDGGGAGSGDESKVYDLGRAESKEFGDDNMSYISSVDQDNIYQQNALVTVMRSLYLETGSMTHLKSLVGIKLREINPQAFGTKDARNDLFTWAKIHGIVREEGYGGSVTLQLMM